MLSTLIGVDTCNKPGLSTSFKIYTCESNEESAKPDDSVRCPLEDVLDPSVLTECTAKTLISLRGCAG